MEKYFDDMIPNFSTAKSPMMMQGAITKTYYAEKAKVDPKDIFSVGHHAMYGEEIRNRPGRQHAGLGI